MLFAVFHIGISNVQKCPLLILFSMVRATDNRTNIIILAGGKGTRLAPYTTVFPKPLVPIDDRPILEIVIRQLASYGLNNITIAVGHLSELIEAFFGSGEKLGVKIDYSREEKPLGTVAPIRLIKNLSENFLLMNGDVLTTLNYKKLIFFRLNFFKSNFINIKPIFFIYHYK